MKKIISIAAIALSTLLLIKCNSIKYVPVSADVPTANVGYTTHIKPVLNNFCMTCHGGEHPAGKVSLKNYALVRKQVEKGNLLKRINDHADPMPVGGLMPKNEREIFKKWAANNYLEIGKVDSSTTAMNDYQFTPPSLAPIDVEEHPVSLLEQMQGHWVGDMVLMGEKIPWFAFDYRAIAPAHVHGIFEGGSMGNLFTSFFVADFKGTKTIMARNGGILNGIYRTSYFVLDQATSKNGESYYRLIDAYGGDQIMWMELRFKNDQLTFTSYTSRFGTYPKPTKHMSFKGTKMHPELAQNAAKNVGFPTQTTQFDFSTGLPTPDWEDYGTPTSASYLWQDVNKDLITLGELSKDPVPINKMPYLSSLKLQFIGDSVSQNHNIQVYVSNTSLTTNGSIATEYGYIQKNTMNNVLLFPEIAKGVNEFTFNYLHPGDYYITTWIDLDGNLALSTGDKYSQSIPVTVKPNSIDSLRIELLMDKEI